MRLGTFLMFVRRSNTAPRTQRDVFARVAEFNWIGRLPARERETDLDVFCDFVTREIPTLSSALLENTPESMAHLSRPAFEEAVRRLPLKAARTRLRYLAVNLR